MMNLNDTPRTQTLLSTAERYRNGICASNDFQGLPVELQVEVERTFESALGVLRRIEAQRHEVVQHPRMSPREKAERIRDIVRTEGQVLDRLEAEATDENAVEQARQWRGSDSPVAQKAKAIVTALDHRKMLVGHIRRAVTEQLR